MRAFGPPDSSSPRVAALKPDSIRFFSGVEFNCRLPYAQWWFVTTRPWGDTKLAVHPPRETTAPIGCPVRSASCPGGSSSPASCSGPAISGSCCGTHMPSPARAGPAHAASANARVFRVSRMGVAPEIGDPFEYSRARIIGGLPKAGTTDVLDDEGAGQARARQGHLDAGRAGAGARPERGPGQGREDRHLRHRPAYLPVGRVE